MQIAPLRAQMAREVTMPAFAKHWVLRQAWLVAVSKSPVCNWMPIGTHHLSSRFHNYRHVECVSHRKIKKAEENHEELIFCIKLCV